MLNNYLDSEMNNQITLIKNLKLFLIISPILYILWLISPLEFIEKNFGSIFFLIITFIYSVYLLIFLNLIAFKKSENSKKSKDLISKIIFNFFYGSCMLVIMLFIIFGLFAVAWRETTLFESKNNSDVHIISQYLDGGAWDSGDSDYRIKKTTRFLYIFRSVSDFDTTNIDRNIWIRENKWK